ncbi:MAG: hypothetical protein FJ115_08735 [Deltaproteobacteria bacterium]|nr:hypothetical protein [Deltaproteobacteria bacterium]MBM4323627.1 hypothetical protein [Deltaproteobacteria bacterium]
MDLQLQIPWIAGLPKDFIDSRQVYLRTIHLPVCCQEKNMSGPAPIIYCGPFYFRAIFKRKGGQDARVKKMLFLSGIWGFERE